MSQLLAVGTRVAQQQDALGDSPEASPAAELLFWEPELFELAFQAGIRQELVLGCAADS